MSDVDIFYLHAPDSCLAMLFIRYMPSVAP